MKAVAAVLGLTTLNCGGDSDRNPVSSLGDAGMGSDVSAVSAGDAGVTTAGDTAQTDAGKVPPTGNHFGFVLDKLELPTNNYQAREVGFDLNGDGAIDNQFGMVSGTFALQGFDLNGENASSIAKGELIVLGNLQAVSLSSAKGAAFKTYFGRNPVPAACADEKNCGRHLEGTASFMLDPSPPGESCEGSIESSVFTCQGGSLPMRFVWFGAQVEFTLHHARVVLQDPTVATVPAGRIGGAISEYDISNSFYPAWREGAAATIDRDCTGKGTACGCPAGSTGATLLNLLDLNRDCAVSLSEIKENSLFASLLAPDLDMDGDGKAESLSCAFAISAKKATFNLK